MMMQESEEQDVPSSSSSFGSLPSPSDQLDNAPHQSQDEEYFARQSLLGQLRNPEEVVASRGNASMGQEAAMMEQLRRRARARQSDSLQDDARAHRVRRPGTADVMERRAARQQRKQRSKKLPVSRAEQISMAATRTADAFGRLPMFLVILTVAGTCSLHFILDPAGPDNWTPLHKQFWDSAAETYAWSRREPPRCDFIVLESGRGVSENTFLEHYYRGDRPVLIRGISKNKSLRKEWSVNTFLRRYGFWDARVSSSLHAANVWASLPEVAPRGVDGAGSRSLTFSEYIYEQMRGRMCPIRSRRARLLRAREKELRKKAAEFQKSKTQFSADRAEDLIQEANDLAEQAADADHMQAKGSSVASSGTDLNNPWFFLDGDGAFWSAARVLQQQFRTPWPGAFASRMLPFWVNPKVVSMGGSGAGIPFAVASADGSAESWTELMFGRRRWTLFPPGTPMDVLKTHDAARSSLQIDSAHGNVDSTDEEEQILAHPNGRAGETSADHTSADQVERPPAWSWPHTRWIRSWYSLADIAPPPDSERPLECEQRETDVLYIPPGWHVAFANLGEVFSVSQFGGRLKSGSSTQ